MENVMLTVKFIMFLAMQVTVLAVIAGVLLAGLYQIVRDKVLESRRQDQIAAADPAQLGPTV